MRRTSKQIIRRLLSYFGLRLEYIRTPESCFSKLDISLVIDVGANNGQYGLEIRREGYTGTIYSFEPLIDAYERLLQNTYGDKKWQVHSRCAVGDSIAEVEINVAGNSYSSSIKEMLPSHISAAPNSGTVGTNYAKMITLDSLIDTWQSQEGKILLKIDTQGFEEEVLKGAEMTIAFVYAVQIELSVVELYKGQSLYRFFFELLESRGFCLYRIIPGFMDDQSGRLLQFDAIFVRNEKLP